MRTESVTKQVSTAVSEGWVEGGSFLGSILAGTALGLGLDAWLKTGPWLVVGGVVLGSYSGFAGMWRRLKSQPPAQSLTRPVAVPDDNHPSGQAGPH